MPVVALVDELVSGHPHLRGVHDDDEIAGVAVRRVLGLPLPAQRVGDLGGEAPEHGAVGVEQQPVALARGGCGDVGPHSRRVKNRARPSAA